MQTVIDIGANEGQYLDHVRASWPSVTKILCVEMLPDLAAKLKARAPAGVTVVHAAVGASVGEIMCRATKSFPMASSLRYFTETGRSYWPGCPLEQTDVGPVPMTTLDALVAEWHPTGAIDVLKIDVQGGEREVLTGAAETLKRVQAIYIEVFFVPVYVGAALAGELFTLLADAGFRVEKLVDVFHHKGVQVCADAWLRRA